MPATVLFNPPTLALPPLAFATPVPSPNLRLRRRDRAANESPPPLKRKRTQPPLQTATDNMEGSFLPTFTNLPFLDCENFARGSDTTNEISKPSALPLPSITLYPKTKRSRIGCFVSSSPQEEYDYGRSNDTQEIRRQVTCVSSEENNDIATNTDASHFKTLQRTSSSKSMLTRTSSSKSMLARRPSMNLSRSLSLQFNMSLMNLAAGASNNDCPISASTSSSMPQRKSLLHIPGNDVQNQDANRDQNNRRSPVAATLDYLATAFHFPDVAIGLSI